jgi:hypothetical protein
MYGYNLTKVCTQTIYRMLAIAAAAGSGSV